MSEPISWEGAATITAALLGAVVVVIGYFVQRSLARRAELGDLYAQALRALDDYLEAHFSIRRKDGSAATRVNLVAHVSDIQSRLAHADALLTQRAPRFVLEAFREAVTAARREAGELMTSAWNAPPVRRDRDVPLRGSFPTPAATSTRQRLIDEMAPGARLIRRSLWVLIPLGGAVPIGAFLCGAALPDYELVAAVVGATSSITSLGLVIALVAAPLRAGRRRLAGAILLTVALVVGFAAGSLLVGAALEATPASDVFTASGPDSGS